MFGRNGDLYRRGNKKREIVKCRFPFKAILRQYARAAWKKCKFLEISS
jgi:hypothetical protein